MSVQPDTRQNSTKQKIDYSTLPSVVTDRLRELIIEGQLTPGARLNERELCDLLGVSRTPLREAFQTLAFEGLIDIQPNKGARVTVLSRKDIEESFTLLGALEELAGQLACAQASEDEILEITALTYEMQAFYTRQDLPNYYRLNREIHRKLIHATGNDLLEKVHTHLNRRLQSLRFRSNLNQEKWTIAMEEHLALVDALKDRNGEALGRLLKEHLKRKSKFALAEFSPRADATAATK